MKVLLCGEFSEGSVAEFCGRALLKEGVKLEIVNFATYKPIFLNRILNRFLKTPRFFGTASLNNFLHKKASEFKPNLILFLKPIFITPVTLEKLSRQSLLFSWYPDYLMYPKTSSVDFIKSIPIYDCHFSFGSANAKIMSRFGAKKSFFLPFAVDLACHHPINLSSCEEDKLGADIVFVGTYDSDNRLEILEKLSFEGYKLKIYGNGWEAVSKTSILRKNGAIQFKAPRCIEMAKALSASKIALGFLRKHNADQQTMRTYEIPACGVFMLHERTEEATALFSEGEEAEFFSSYEELKMKIDKYIGDPEKRMIIARNGYKKVISADYTYGNRVRKILKIYKEFKNNGTKT